jgi:hypothetical protein
MGAAAIACIVAIPAVLIFQNHISVEIAKEAANFPMGSFLMAVTLLLLLAAAMLGMIFRVFQLLKRIVDTVGEGDPFVPLNARRLTQMAWLTLGVQLVTLPMGGIAIWLMQVTREIRDKGDTFVIDGGLDGNGLLLVLVLFILARVFREGARMREELEGTV